MVDAVRERIEPDGERKLVTVLFADVKGSMDMAEQQDPEQWRGIMQGFFSILSDAVHRFEGTVDKFTGDGIMAVFGAPIAHEDHARRACYAALRMLDDISEYAAELRRKHGLNFSARIGINSGEVIAGAIGEGEGSYTAIGHTVGLAQRMEALAEPGKAYLAEAAAELAARLPRARGPRRVRDQGLEPAGRGSSSWPGIGSARSRLDLSRERGFSRFVGREEELAMLEDGLERGARPARAPWSASSPNRGSARAASPPSSPSAAAARGVEVFEAQAQAHGQETPFMPVLQILRAYFGISDADPERLSREKIAGRALLLDPGLLEDLPVLFDFLGLPDPDRPAATAQPRGPAARAAQPPLQAPPRPQPARAIGQRDRGPALDGRGQRRAARRAAGRSRARRRWSSSTSGPSTRRAGASSRTTSQIPLEPLGPGRHRELLRDLVGEDPSLDGLAELIHERTAGNPFFIEEIVRELAESGRARGRARRPAAGPAGLRHQGPRQRADGPRRADRPARRRRKAAAAGDVGRRPRKSPSPP